MDTRAIRMTFGCERRGVGTAVRRRMRNRKREIRAARGRGTQRTRDTLSRTNRTLINFLIMSNHCSSGNATSFGDWNEFCLRIFGDRGVAVPKFVSPTAPFPCVLRPLTIFTSDDLHFTKSKDHWKLQNNGFYKQDCHPNHVQLNSLGNIKGKV